MPTCMLLTEAELDALISEGYTVVSGPYTTSEECEATCGAVTVDCCPMDPIPSTLYLTLGGVSGGTCPCAEGNYALVWNGTDKWIWSGLICGIAAEIRFYCYSNPSFAIEIHGPGGNGTSTNPPSSCGPTFGWSAPSPINMASTGICDDNIGTAVIGITPP